MQMQAFLNAAVINLKRLTEAVLLALFAALTPATAPTDNAVRHPSQAS
jgi:hypothetical protein